ncbi:MAG: hypothetical protein WBV06_11900 [Acidimicrobiia bacterium]
MRGRAWLTDLTMGGLVGGVVGAIAAVNVIIYSGIEGGYEASIKQVFRQNTIVGVLTVLVFAAGPVAGVIVARRMRRKRGTPPG